MCTAVCPSRKSPRRLPASSPLAGPRTATHAAAARLQHTCVGKTINTVCFVSLFSMFLPRGSKVLNSWFYWACCFSACAHVRMCVHGGASLVSAVSFLAEWDPGGRGVRSSPVLQPMACQQGLQHPLGPSALSRLPTAPTSWPDQLASPEVLFSHSAVDICPYILASFCCSFFLHPSPLVTAV